MRTKPPEMILRERIVKVMSGHWKLTWHEDREINPGVPDLSFVMHTKEGKHHETGWIELKAMKATPLVPLKKSLGTRLYFEVQRPQIDWIERHCGFIPVYLLIAVGDNWYLLHGSQIQEVARPIYESRLEELSIWMDSFDSIDKSALVDVLSNITRRDRGFI